MATLILDHPWAIADAMRSDSDAFEVLENFHQMIGKKKGLDPVPFIPLEQYTSLWDVVEDNVEDRAAATYFIRLVESYVRWEGAGEITATPQPEPEGIHLPVTWKQALRSSMRDLHDWRSPQIIVSNKRAREWPSTREVTIRIDETGGRELRVLSSIDGYESHPFTMSDFDPWDLGRCHLAGDSGRVSRHPCHLPKHPDLQDVVLEQLRAKLAKLREKGWRYRINGVDKGYYVPPDDWNPLDVGQGDWRQCRAFRNERAGGDRGIGPVDHWNQIWIWDRGGKRHWDVQMPVRNPENDPEYCVISHTGDVLRDYVAP